MTGEGGCGGSWARWGQLWSQGTTHSGSGVGGGQAGIEILGGSLTSCVNVISPSYLEPRFFRKLGLSYEYPLLRSIMEI